MITDMMTHFELYQPSRIEDALALLDRHDKDVWKLAGGNDSLDWFKDRIKRPKAVVDLAGLAELKGIRQVADGIEIGALSTLTEIERNPVIREKFGLLADAARMVASPQIRNAGTLGGNLAQDARCWYYRDGFPCYRAGGNTCYADTPTGMNREHALFGANRCVAVSPSDTAPALTALEAKMIIRNSKGQREVEAKDFFIGPSVDIKRMTILTPRDILTAVRIPAKWAGARFYFEKVSDRKTWDFALVSVASALIVKGGVIEQAGIACGGVECVPRHLKVVGDVVKGERQNEDTARLAGQAAVRGAVPLNYNHFKVTLMQNLVTRAVRGV
ncbi:MAG: FAD binding domain-containing protein [Desulfobacterales bacterium]|nr:FAD binding domain-containing protein [Desulfobacterales bacterium]